MTSVPKWNLRVCYSVNNRSFPRMKDLAFGFQFPVVTLNRKLDIYFSLFYGTLIRSWFSFSAQVLKEHNTLHLVDPTHPPTHPPCLAVHLFNILIHILHIDLHLFPLRIALKEFDKRSKHLFYNLFSWKSITNAGWKLMLVTLEA